MARQHRRYEYLSVSQLTSQPGPERFPGLSPDGRTLIYSSTASGNEDIYLLRVGGENPINLTADSKTGDSQPAFSPDGDSIAFRSERQGGGIFLMGATGESVRRLTDFGFNPSWSPDGKEIVFASERVVSNPRSRRRGSQLWVVSLEDQEVRQISVPDGVQPSWSPNGQRIAFWAQTTGQRDIWTISAKGGGARCRDLRCRAGLESGVGTRRSLPLLLEHPGRDDEPVASSHRGAIGSDARTSSAGDDRCDGGEHAPLHLAGREAARLRIGARDRQRREGLVRSRNAGAGGTRLRDQGLGGDDLRRRFSGRDLALLLPVRGTGRHLHRALRRHRDAAAHPGRPQRPRTPMVARRKPHRLLLQSQRHVPDLDHQPRWQRARAAHRGPAVADLSHLVPGRKRLAISDLDTGWLLVPFPRDPTAGAPPLLPPIGDGEILVPRSWSPDGKWIAGERRFLRDNRTSGIAVYSLATGEYELLSDFGSGPTWWNDSRTILFTDLSDLGLGGTATLYVVDRVTKEPRPVPHRDIVFGPAVSPDGRTLYYSRVRVEGDLWLVTLP